MPCELEASYLRTLFFPCTTNKMGERDCHGNKNNLLFHAFLLFDSEVVHGLLESRRVEVKEDLVKLLNFLNVLDIVTQLDLVLFFLLRFLVALLLLGALLLEPLLLFSLLQL